VLKSPVGCPHFYLENSFISGTCTTLKGVFVVIPYYFLLIPPEKGSSHASRKP